MFRWTGGTRARADQSARDSVRYTALAPVVHRSGSPQARPLSSPAAGQNPKSEAHCQVEAPLAAVQATATTELLSSAEQASRLVQAMTAQQAKDTQTARIGTYDGDTRFRLQGEKRMRNKNGGESDDNRYEHEPPLQQRRRRHGQGSGTAGSCPASSAPSSSHAGRGTCLRGGGAFTSDSQGTLDTDYRAARESIAQERQRRRRVRNATGAGSLDCLALRWPRPSDQHTQSGAAVQAPLGEQQSHGRQRCQPCEAATDEMGGAFEDRPLLFSEEQRYHGQGRGPFAPLPPLEEVDSSSSRNAHGPSRTSDGPAGTFFPVKADNIADFGGDYEDRLFRSALLDDQVEQGAELLRVRGNRAAEEDSDSQSSVFASYADRLLARTAAAPLQGQWPAATVIGAAGGFLPPLDNGGGEADINGVYAFPFFDNVNGAYGGSGGLLSTSDYDAACDLGGSGAVVECEPLRRGGQQQTWLNGSGGCEQFHGAPFPDGLWGGEEVGRFLGSPPNGCFYSNSHHCDRLPSIASPPPPCSRLQAQQQAHALASASLAGANLSFFSQRPDRRGVDFPTRPVPSMPRFDNASAGGGQPSAQRRRGTRGAVFTLNPGGGGESERYRSFRNRCRRFGPQ